MFNGRRQPSRDGTSRMTREYQVRFCERLGVKFPGPTRQTATKTEAPLCQLPAADYHRHWLSSESCHNRTYAVQQTMPRSITSSVRPPSSPYEHFCSLLAQ